MQHLKLSIFYDRSKIGPIYWGIFWYILPVQALWPGQRKAYNLSSNQSLVWTEKRLLFHMVKTRSPNLISSNKVRKPWLSLHVRVTLRKLSFLPLSLSRFKSKIRNWIEKTKCRIESLWKEWTSQQCPEGPIDRYVQFISKLDRKHCRMLVGLLTGHINLQYMLHKMRRAKTPSCRRCGAEKETLVHILCECLLLEKVRMQTLGFARMDPEQIKEASLSCIVALGKRTELLNSSLWM